MSETPPFTASDYHQLNFGAHRRTFLQVQAPALTCHLGFWTPLGLSDQQRDLWKENIDKSICYLISHARQAALKPNRVSFSTEANARLFLFNDCFDVESLEKIAKSELRPQEVNILDSDYRNVCVTLQYQGFDVSLSYELHSEYLTITGILQFSSFEKSIFEASTAPFGELIDALNTLGKYLRIRSGGPMPSAKSLYNDFWDDLISRYIKSFTDEHPSQLGEVFADFRGVIISDETKTFRDQSFWNEATRSWPQWGDASIEKLQALIGDPDKHEVTACYMLGGRALYITDLGPQDAIGTVKQRTPTRYMVYVHQKDLSMDIGIVNKWQLGRLIDRVHWLGTHRLAALKNLPELRQAGRILASLYGKGKHTLEQLKPHEISRRESELYKALRGHMELIPDNIQGGLQYRTERSRYYVDNFRRMVRTLRIIRIEGYQPFDLFIENRLGSTFSFIDRLGLRYERAQKAIAQIRADAAMDEVLSVQKLLLSIQDLGEKILILGLLPYYVAHLVIMTRLDLGLDPLFTIAIWSGFISYYYHIKCKVDDPHERLKNTRERNVIILIILAVIIYVVIGMAIWPSKFYPIFGRSTDVLN